MRPYRDEDAPLLFSAAIESAETVGRWMPWCHAQYASEDSAVWVKKSQACWHTGEEYSFALFDHAGQYVGGAGLNHFNRDHNIANLGYWVRQSRQRQGFAVAAARCLAKFGFETLGLTRIEIIAATDNRASRRVAEKCGAEFECLARNRLVIRDDPVTAAVYSLIPTPRS
ncbi:MAG TPA: GNAT family N-acetyltransferase [Casimicrobiaceae bacterium]|jgi:RimJ/RimL family protein N-acetyltransferase